MEQSYKEKYEKALEKIKNLIDKDHNDINVDDILNVFPELAESEDEKVRKEIIELVMQPIWKTEKEFHRRNELCAWLKKQGQVKESTISQHENRTCEENGNSLTYKGEGIRKEIINYFQCQSEEEPTRKEIHNKWIAWLENIPVTIDHEKREGFHLGYKAGLERLEMKTAAESLGVDSETYNKIVDECIFGEQKKEENKGNIGGISPNWSVEDRSKVQRMCKYLNEAKKYYADITEVRECIEWLHSLQDRVQPQPKQKWSEEDSFRTETLISVIKSGGSIRPELRNEFVYWLKSLRPLKRWKPSDEQIGLLQAIINEPNNATSESCQIVLKDILEQLKKLKKEYV